MAAWISPRCFDAAKDVATLQGLECAFRNVLNVIAQIILLVFFIMILIGGFKYLTSGGDPKATEAASHTLTYAVFGLFGLVLIWLLLKLIEVITGVQVTIFKVEIP